MKIMRFHKKHILLIAIIILLICFLVYSLVWRKVIFDKYDQFIVDESQWTRLEGSNLIHGRGYMYNEDGFDYNIKYPDFLSYIGNLGLSDPDDILSLIIWPKFWGETKYGIMIYHEEETYSVMVDEKMNPIDKHYEEIIEENKTGIKELFDRANKKWDF